MPAHHPITRRFSGLSRQCLALAEWPSQQRDCAGITPALLFILCRRQRSATVYENYINIIVVLWLFVNTRQRIVYMPDNVFLLPAVSGSPERKRGKG